MNVPNAKVIRISGFQVKDITEKLNENKIETPQNEDEEL